MEGRRLAALCPYSREHPFCLGRRDNVVLTFQEGKASTWKRLNYKYQKYLIMNEIIEQAKAQLMMIEQIYRLKIINRDEVATLIAANVDNDRQVLTICSSLNSWILLNKKRGDVVIPREVLSRLFETTNWQKKHT